MTIEKNVKTALKVSDQELCFDSSNQLFDTLLDQIGEITTLERFSEKLTLERACIELMNTELSFNLKQQMKQQLEEYNK